MEQNSTPEGVTDTHVWRDNVLARRTRRQIQEQREPVVATIEIVERRQRPPSEDWADDVIAPDDIRINGQSLVAPTGYPVKVHEVVSDAGNVVMVTLTLLAKRVFIGAEYPEDREHDHPDGVEYRDKLAGLGMLPAEAA